MRFLQPQQQSSSNSQTIPYRPSRRTVLRGTALTIGQLAAGEAIQSVASETRKKFPLVIVWLEGAASPWKTFMPHKSDAMEDYKGKSYATVDTRIAGVRLSKVLPDVAELMHTGVLIRSLDAQTNDHFKSTTSMLIENNDPARQTLGAFLGTQLERGGAPYSTLNMPGHYAADGATIRDQQFSQSFYSIFSPATGKFRKPDVRKDPRFAERMPLLRGFDTAEIHSPAAKRQGKAMDTAIGMMSGDSRYFDAFELSEEDMQRFGPLREVRRFGEKDANVPNPLAASAAVAHHMVTEGGAGVVTIHHCEREGWDTHVNEDQEIEILGGHLNLALAELIRRARTDGYAVVCMSEMGRTPRLNPAASSDHYHVHFAAGWGGKFAEGVVIGDYCRVGRITKDGVQNTKVFPTIVAATGVEVDPRIQRVREATP